MHVVHSNTRIIRDPLTGREILTTHCEATKPKKWISAIGDIIDDMPNDWILRVEFRKAGPIRYTVSGPGLLFSFVTIEELERAIAEYFATAPELA